MCGIWLYLAQHGTYDEKEIFKTADKIEPRGPDMNTKFMFIFNNYKLYLKFYRLAIMDLSNLGMQPFVITDNDRTIALMCNGEIYNHEYLIDKYDLKSQLKSHSDCEVLVHLYKKIGIEKLYEELMGDNVDGEFAFIVVDKTKTSLQIHVARDMGGVRPLYVANTNTHDNKLESLCFSSQLSGVPNKDKIYCEQYKPYSYTTYSFDIDLNQNLTFVNTKKVEFNLRDIPITIYDEEEALEKVRNTFIKCVEQRMHSDREIMFMCSGGLDSSLCAGIGANYVKNHGGKIRTMSIGLDGGTDEIYARMVGEHINSDHLHVLCTEEEFLDAAKNRVIDTIESYDITTVRASTGQLIAAEKIKEFTDCKVVIIGDYSDEITGGYNETKMAPSIEDFNERIYELVENIHYFDAQRADRCIAMNGLEARTPFADHRFIKLYLSIDPKLRINRDGVEKYLLRKAFSGKNFIPENVIWRPKEAFSDGVSSLKKSWYSILQEDIDKMYTDEDIEDAKKNYKHNTPYTKESLHYRKRFCETFDENVSNVIPYFWLPKWGNVKDPSARVLNVYKP